MNGLFSPPGASWLMAGAPLPGMLPMMASVTTTVPSLMPLMISVLTPLEIPIFTGWAVKVLPSRVQSLCSPFAILHDIIVADKRFFGG